MRNNTVFEPRAVYVFAKLAAINESEAHRLLTRAAAHHGAHVSSGGNVSCEDKGTFARVWEQAAQELRRLREVS
jgi:hypothetical protein